MTCYLQIALCGRFTVRWCNQLDLCWVCKTLPGEHDDAMGNFVLAQAVPAASDELLVFA